MLTYAGDGQRCARARGRNSGCRGCCSGVRKPESSANAGETTECDEFPFKSTVEGGAGAWTRCVTAWQNQLQGHYLGSWYAANGLVAGSRFVVRVVGLDCSTVQPTDLQGCAGSGSGSGTSASSPGTVVASGTETVARPSLDNRTNLVIAPFGDLDAGDFRANLRLALGRLSRLSIIDSDGAEVAPSPADLEPLNSLSGLSLDLALDEYAGGLGAIGEIDGSGPVNLSWELVATERSASGSANGAGAGARGGVAGVCLLMLLLGLSLWLFM